MKLYHCSNENYGQRWVAKPRLPKYPASGEPPVPRVCVCTSIAKCFAARLFDPKPVYVYRTARPYRGVKPRGVWDLCVTGERWLVEPTEFELVLVLPAEQVLRAIEAVRLYHRIKRKGSNLRLRVAQLREAARVFGESSSLAERWCETLDVGEDYLLEAACGG